MARVFLTRRFEEEDIKRWKKKAAKDKKRNLTVWMEEVLNEAAKEKIKKQ